MKNGCCYYIFSCFRKQTNVCEEEEDLKSVKNIQLPEMIHKFPADLYFYTACDLETQEVWTGYGNEQNTTTLCLEQVLRINLLTDELDIDALYCGSETLIFNNHDILLLFCEFLKNFGVVRLLRTLMETPSANLVGSTSHTNMIILFYFLRRVSTLSRIICLDILENNLFEHLAQHLKLQHELLTEYQKKQQDDTSVNFDITMSEVKSILTVTLHVLKLCPESAVRNFKECQLEREVKHFLDVFQFRVQYLAFLELTVSLDLDTCQTITYATQEMLRYTVRHILVETLESPTDCGPFYLELLSDLLETLFTFSKNPQN